MKKARWLLVVRSDQEELYELLRQRLADDDRVEVVLDRRERERRQGSGGGQRERRRGNRRQRPPAWASVYDAREWSVAETGRGVSGRASNGGEDQDRPGWGTKTCPRCGVIFEFDMPRFVEPPARVVFTVVHTEDPVLGAQHAIDTEAFTPSGRTLLATRSQARRQIAPPGAV